ncbi:2-hydroxyacyl-CoA dehydratase family protein, partial [Salmonella enterica]|uniref:2-hydroxyacyl-CoA dehydratase family protein n=1 Tax=Salmonella enterica TaxID=28901 RepID=UPI003296D1D5
SRELPEKWWTYLRDRCEEIIDLNRLEQRVEQIKNLIAWLEVRVGRPFSFAKLRETMLLLNEQLKVWEGA